MLETLQQILYFFGGGFCHQYAWRSLEAGGLYFPVCARDTGIYLGFIVALIVLLVLTLPQREKPTAFPPVWAVMVCVVLAVPMVLDGASSYLGLRETNNLIRYITGYLCGTSLGVVVSGGILALLPRRNSEAGAVVNREILAPLLRSNSEVGVVVNREILAPLPRSNSEVSAVGKPLRFAAVLAACYVVGAAFYVVYPLMGVAAPFLILVCLWLTVVLVNVLIFSTTRWWMSNKPHRRRQIVLLCLLMAVAELAIISLVANGFEMLFPWIVHP